MSQLPDILICLRQSAFSNHTDVLHYSDRHDGNRFDSIYWSCSANSSATHPEHYWRIFPAKGIQHQEPSVQCERPNRSHRFERWKFGQFSTKSSPAISPFTASDQFQQQPHVHSVRIGSSETRNPTAAEPETTTGSFGFSSHPTGPDCNSTGGHNKYIWPNSRKSFTYPTVRWPSNLRLVFPHLRSIGIQIRVWWWTVRVSPEPLCKQRSIHSCSNFSRAWRPRSSSFWSSSSCFSSKWNPKPNRWINNKSCLASFWTSLRRRGLNFGSRSSKQYRSRKPQWWLIHSLIKTGNLAWHRQAYRNRTYHSQAEANKKCNDTRRWFNCSA